MRFKINWTERVGYYTYINANSPEEAKKLFYEDGLEAASPAGFCEPDGFSEMEDNIEVEIEDEN